MRTLLRLGLKQRLTGVLCGAEYTGRGSCDTLPVIHGCCSISWIVIRLLGFLISSRCTRFFAVRWSEWFQTYNTLLFIPSSETWAQEVSL